MIVDSKRVVGVVTNFTDLRRFEPVSPVYRLASVAAYFGILQNQTKRFQTYFDIDIDYDIDTDIDNGYEYRPSLPFPLQNNFIFPTSP